MRPLLRGLCLAVALAGAASCGGDESTGFAPGLTALEPSRATRPVMPGAQRCPEAVNVVTGDTPEYEWAHARGCVHVPAARVWAALQDADVMVDRRRVSTFTTSRDVEPAYALSYRVRHVVRDIITLEFDHTWRGAINQGTAQSPRELTLAYQKTWGSNFITILRGSVVARPIDPDTTEVELVRHIKSAGAGRAEAAQYLRDAFASLVERAHDRPLPRFN